MALLRLLQRTRAVDAARALSQRLLTLYPNDVDVLLHAARLERSTGQYQDALGFYRQARQIELVAGAQATEPSESALDADDLPPLPLRLAYSLVALDAATPVDAIVSDGPPDTEAGAMPELHASEVLASALPSAALFAPANVPITALDKIDLDINSIEARRQAWVELGHEKLEKNSTEGVSTLRGWERPVVAFLPWRYDGRMFLHVDQVQLDAGVPTANAAEVQDFGQVAAWPASAYQPAVYPQTINGFNLGVGYEGDKLSWDIGTVGVGFPVSNVVGGLSTSGELGRYGYNVAFSRRPVTGSLLSYVGMRDPVTGDVRGGVVATGVGGRLSTEVGPFNLSTSASYAVLTGQNVMDNTRLQWRSAVDRDVYTSATQVLNLGLALSIGQYEHDLSGFTWGHGGYYSPQSNVSLALPVQWSGREGLFSWLLRGSVSATQSSSDAANYFPTQAPLQAQALAQQGNPIFAGSSGPGSGKSFSGVAEYQATPQLAIGARLERDLSDYYTPLNLLFYARYLFDPVLTPLAKRPRPVQAYSKF